MKTPPLTEGFVVKGGRNQGPSQIKDRPAAPGAIMMTKQNLLYWIFKACEDHWNQYHEHPAIENFDEHTFKGISAPGWVWLEFERALKEYKGIK